MLKGLYTPVEQNLMYGDAGVSAVLEQNYVGDANSYDPTATADYIPGKPQRRPLDGVWSDDATTGLKQD